MARPTHFQIDPSALRHNVMRVKACCPQQQIIAMVKANAYGCGLSFVLPVLESHVDAFGVACLEEARAVRVLTSRACILFQGIFSADELSVVVAEKLDCVVHHQTQLQWILNTPLATSIRVWVKVNTGMQRLGFFPEEIYDVLSALNACSWVDKNIGLMTHLACADAPENPQNQAQIEAFNGIMLPPINYKRSVANSAVILSQPTWVADVVRPGIMLYGVSPFEHIDAHALDLKPVMRFMSAVSVIHDYPANRPVGYGGTWRNPLPARIGVVPVGYGDGYPRHIAPLTPTSVNGMIAPIVGRVSMDMLTIDLTHCAHVAVGDHVELWGPTLPVETIARFAGTSAYELMCQISPRVRDRGRIIFS